jgi:hypothetical protein
METKFQTSFIPKKPITVGAVSRVHSSSVPGGFFALFAIIVFIISVAGAIFSFIWTNVLVNTGKQYQTTLQTNENEFNPALIGTLERASMKIGFAKNLLANHLAPDAVFGIIGGLTAEDVSFSSLSYTAPTASNNYITLTMSGVGTSYSAIAFQSDVFGSSVQYGENIAVKNPVLSGLSLNANGDVNFSFTAELDPSNITYSKVLAVALGGTVSPAAPTASTTP